MDHATFPLSKLPRSKEKKGETKRKLFSEMKHITNMPQCYLTSFCNFYSYLLIFPFKFTYCQSSDRFVLTTSKLRKIFCCISHIIVCLATTPYLIGFFMNLSKGWTEPKFLLVCSTKLVSYLTTIDFLNILWRKRESILEVINWHLSINIFHRVSFYKIGFICLYPLTMLLDNPLAAILNDLITGVPSNNGFSFNTSFFNSDDNFLGSFYYSLYAIFLYGHIYYIISTGFILVLTLSIKESLVQLKRLRSFNGQNADVALHQGIKIETEIRSKIKLFNDIMSNKVILEYIMMLSFYATVFEFFEWNYHGAEFHRLHVIFYFLFTGAFWIFACEVHCLVRDYLKEWTFSYRSTYLLESPETLKQYQICLLAVQNEADLNPVCISCRCFNVTYAFIGSMFGLIITFSTIMYQMKSDKNSNKTLFHL